MHEVPINKFTMVGKTDVKLGKLALIVLGSVTR